MHPEVLAKDGSFRAASGGAETALPADPVELLGLNPAQAIERLISQKGLLRQLGEKGRERVLRQFTMEQMARKNEDYYYDLLQMHPEWGFNRAKEEGSRVDV